MNGPRKIPAILSVGVLQCTDAEEKDIKEATAAFNELNGLVSVEPAFSMASIDDLRALIDKSEACVDGFQMKMIRYHEEVVGYFHVFHDFRQQNVLFVSMLLVRPSFANRGIGRSTLKTLTDFARSAGYGEIWAKVSLLNWPALRFWHREGFTKLVDFVGDRAFAPGSAASVVVGHVIERPIQTRIS